MNEDDRAFIRGSIGALNVAVALALAETARMRCEDDISRYPVELELSLRALEQAMPVALAIIEERGQPGASAGFEQTIELITSLARQAVLPPGD